MLASVGLRLRRIWLHDRELGEFFIGRDTEREDAELPSAASIRELRAEILALRNELATGLPQRNDRQI